MGFLSKTQIWKDSSNRLDDVDSCLDALIYKGSRALEVQPSVLQYSWFRHSSFIYGNCVHQINRLDDSFYGPNAPSLDMEIACSNSATVLALGQHRPNVALFREEFLRDLESQSHSYPSGRLMSTVRTSPRYFKSNAHLNL